MLKLQTECYKLLGVSKRLYLVFDLKRLKKTYQTKLLTSAKCVTYSLHVSCFPD